MMRKRCYKELSRLNTFEERYRYLTVTGEVGQSKFGSHRYLIQRFYHSPEWIKVRDRVIIRDNGCDLAMDGYNLDNLTKIYIHHMNPITLDQVLNKKFEEMLDPDYLICCSFDTHNAIHYGDESLLPKRSFVERKPGDTNLW